MVTVERVESIFLDFVLLMRLAPCGSTAINAQVRSTVLVTMDVQLVIAQLNASTDVPLD